MRMGKKKQPTYRLVAADTRSPRDGRFIEILGTYEPRAEPSVINIDNDKAVKWLADGAQPTETVAKLLKISGALDQFETVRPAKTAKPAKAAKPKATKPVKPGNSGKPAKTAEPAKAGAQ
jgi:small subunit ribosomal protein S16